MAIQEIDHEITNPRLLRYREALAPYNFKVSWNAGKNHIVADALSRAPVFPGSPDEGEEEESAHLRLALAEDPALSIITDGAKDDPTYQELIKALQNGLETAPSSLARYKAVWDQLSPLQVSRTTSWTTGSLLYPLVQGKRS